jgi:hypothetical protein
MKKQICSLILCSVMFGLGSAEAAYVSVTDATRNSTRATALNLNSTFDKAFDANIGNPSTNISTSFMHASVNATTNARGFDWYSFTTTQANMQAYFDIDRGMPDLDSWIKLYDSRGVLLSENDDGDILDAGSTDGYDSFLSQVLTNPGLYYLSVGQWSNSVQAALTRGQDYTLHVSFAAVPSPSAVPVPAAVWLFGSGIAGLMASRRKKISAAPLVA